MLDKVDAIKVSTNNNDTTIPTSRTDLVQHVYSGICCEGNKDLTQHWFAQIWPQANTTQKRYVACSKKVNDSLRSSNSLQITFA